MVMFHQLGPRRGARGEIQQHRIGDPRRRIRHEFIRRIQQIGIGIPARRGIADRDAGDRGIESLEFRRIRGVGDNVPDTTAIETVFQIGRIEQRRRGNNHRAQFHRRKHGFPKRHDVAQHQQNALAAFHPDSAQTVG